MRWSALRVLGGNQVDGLPPARHTELRWIGLTMDPQRSAILVEIFMFLVISYIRSYWFVTFKSLILYWSWILCEYQLPCSIKFFFSTLGWIYQNVEKWWFFQKIWKIQFSKAKPFLFRNLKTYFFGKLYFHLKIFMLTNVLKSIRCFRHLKT